MKCNFCLNSKYSKKITKYSALQKRDIEYLICDKCLSINQSPLPTDKLINEYYNSYIDIKKEMNPGYLEENNINNLFIERDKTFKEIGFQKKWFNNKTNVEYGCANGHFLLYLKKNGASNIIGIDISKTLIKSIKIDNVTLINGDLSALNNRSIDNLFMFNVLEHFQDVRRVFDTAARKLKNDAKIVIEVPISGIISKAFSENWRFLMPDEHLHIPSIKGLKKLLNDYNFKIIGKTRFGSGFTKGAINNNIKNILDKSAKSFKFGDRACFLITSK